MDDALYSKGSSTWQLLQQTSRVGRPQGSRFCTVNTLNYSESILPPGKPLLATKTLIDVVFDRQTPENHLDHDGSTPDDLIVKIGAGSCATALSGILRKCHQVGEVSVEDDFFPPAKWQFIHMQFLPAAFTDISEE